MKKEYKKKKIKRANSKEKWQRKIKRTTGRKSKQKKERKMRQHLPGVWRN